tara:strand:- start:918 stop:1604 length:687 start_codon:yes stop_codon:yes gene_type:complete
MSRANDLSGLITPKLVSVGGTSVGINSTSPTSALDVFGTIRATSFIKSDGTPISGGGGGATWGNYDSNAGVTTTKKVKIQNNLEVTGVSTFSGSVSIGGTLTYEDVTNIDSVGFITARSGIKVLAGGIDAVGVVTATTFNSTSDIKLKNNVTTVVNALEVINQLRGVRFDWKESGVGDYGVIAQELEEILPELVSQGDPKTVNYNGIIGVLIESIKELSEKVKSLEDK